MIENADCKRLDRTITCQHQGYLCFIFASGVYLPTRKMKKNHHIILIFCSTKLKFLRRETKGAIT